MLTIVVNGVEDRLEKPLTVQDLLRRLHLPGEKIAVERNQEIVPRSAYGVTWLEEGDRMEIVHFVGGG